MGGDGWSTGVSERARGWEMWKNRKFGLAGENDDRSDLSAARQRAGRSWEEWGGKSASSRGESLRLLEEVTTARLAW